MYVPDITTFLGLFVFVLDAYNYQILYGLSLVSMCSITIHRRCLLGTLARDFQFYRFAVYAAIKLRRQLCAAIINAPMIFFMTENLGPLTEVFTKDLGVINTERKYLTFASRRYQLFSFVLTFFHSVRRNPRGSHIPLYLLRYYGFNFCAVY